MSGLSGWLLCLVNLLVFSAISATRRLYYRCKVLVLPQHGACTVVARWLVLPQHGACGPTTSGIVLARC